MRKLALLLSLLSLLSLGAVGLIACGGGDDDETTAAPATPITDHSNSYDELAYDPADNKFCGTVGGRGLTVVEGDISCREARRLTRRAWNNTAPYRWRCIGPEGATGGYEVCTNPPGASSWIVIKVHFGREAATNKSCGAVDRWRLAVVERGVTCREARHVVHGVAYNRVPDGWTCTGGDQPVNCLSEAGETIRAPVRKAVLHRWEAAEAR